MAHVRFGAQLWSQASDWDGYLGAARAADDAGWDSIWTWDHLLANVGPSHQPVFEGWLAMGAFAAVTRRARLGLMVTANTFRSPGQTAKLAATLDHASGGRACLGIGSANAQREHEAFGIDFGTSPGERLDRLDESLGIIRRLLDGETVTHQGPRYELRDAHISPGPLQHRLPILIGGSGIRKTMPIVARHADAWNTSGSVEEVMVRDGILRERCVSIGRDPASIERTFTVLLVIRDTIRGAQRAYADLCRHNGVDAIARAHPMLGSPMSIAEGLRPYVIRGFATVIVRLPAPYDPETIARIGEVRAALDA